MVHSPVLKLVVRRLVQPEKDDEILVTISTRPDLHGLGFAIAGGIDSPIEDGDPAIYITEIESDGPAHAAGFRFGDRLVSVNGTDLESVRHQTAVEVLQDAAHAAELVCQVARIPRDQEEGERILTIEFGKSVETSFGLAIAGGADDPISHDDRAVYITTIKAGGAAAADGRLRIGDRIVVCNGVLFANINHADAVKTIKSNPTGVKFIVSRITELEYIENEV